MDQHLSIWVNIYKISPNGSIRVQLGNSTSFHARLNRAQLGKLTSFRAWAKLSSDIPNPFKPEPGYAEFLVCYQAKPAWTFWLEPAQASLVHSVQGCTVHTPNCCSFLCMNQPCPKMIKTVPATRAYYSTVHSVQYTLYSEQCTVHTAQWTVYSAHSTVHTTHCSLYSGLVYRVQLTVLPCPHTNLLWWN